MTAPRRLLLALALSALCHAGFLALTRHRAPEGAAEAQASGQRFAIAMVDRAGSRTSAELPDRSASRAAPDAGEVPSEPAPEVVPAPPQVREPVAVSPRKPEPVAAPPPRRRPVLVPVRERAVEPVAAANPAVVAVPEAPAVQRAPVSNASAAADPAGGGEGSAPSAEGGGAAGASGPRMAALHSGMAADLRPWCRNCPVPDYPARARRRGWQGTVDIDLALNDDGSVDGARVVRSSGFPALDAAAIAVARRSRFRVPEAGGALHGKLRYQFRLEQSL